MLVDMSILPVLGLHSSCVFWRCFADCEIQNGKCKGRRYQAKTSKPCSCSKCPNRSDCCSFIYSRAILPQKRRGVHSRRRSQDPRPSGWWLLRLKTGASSLHYFKVSWGFCGFHAVWGHFAFSKTMQGRNS